MQLVWGLEEFCGKCQNDWAEYFDPRRSVKIWSRSVSVKLETDILAGTKRLISTTGKLFTHTQYASSVRSRKSWQQQVSSFPLPLLPPLYAPKLFHCGNSADWDRERKKETETTYQTLSTLLFLCSTRAASLKVIDARRSHSAECISTH